MKLRKATVTIDYADGTQRVVEGMVVVRDEKADRLFEFLDGHGGKVVRTERHTVESCTIRVIKRDTAYDKYGV